MPGEDRDGQGRGEHSQPERPVCSQLYPGDLVVLAQGSSSSFPRRQHSRTAIASPAVSAVLTMEFSPAALPINALMVDPPLLTVRFSIPAQRILH